MIDEDSKIIEIIGQEAYDGIVNNWGGRQVKCRFDVDGYLFNGITIKTDEDSWKFFGSMEGLWSQLKKVQHPVFLLYMAQYEESPQCNTKKLVIRSYPFRNCKYMVS